MRIAAVIVLILTVGLWPAWSDPGAERPEALKKKIITRDKVSDYVRAAGKRQKYQMCIQAGGAECRKRYREAYQWCLKNPDECFLLTEGAGASARQYAGQEAAKCKGELDRKCRSQAGL